MKTSSKPRAAESSNAPGGRVPPRLSFQAKLESISDELEYYALPIPAEITEALGTRRSVPVAVRINGSAPFLVSLYARGGGRHGMRVKASVRKETGIKEGDRVKVEITVRDPSDEVALPADVKQALQAAKLLAAFEAIPPGARSFMLRKIAEAVQPETRQKRIQAVVAEAFKRSSK